VLARRLAVERTPAFVVFWIDDVGPAARAGVAEGDAILPRDDGGWCSDGGVEDSPTIELLVRRSGLNSAKPEVVQVRPDVVRAAVALDGWPHPLKHVNPGESHWAQRTIIDRWPAGAGGIAGELRLDGRPVSDVLLEVVLNARRTQTARTAGDGRFSIAVPPGGYVYGGIRVLDAVRDAEAIRRACPDGSGSMGSRFRERRSGCGSGEACAPVRYGPIRTGGSSWASSRGSTWSPAGRSSGPIRRGAAASPNRRVRIRTDSASTSMPPPIRWSVSRTFGW
jgi:hypothetical protein